MIGCKPSFSPTLSATINNSTLENGTNLVICSWKNKKYIEVFLKQNNMVRAPYPYYYCLVYNFNVQTTCEIQYKL